MKESKFWIWFIPLLLIVSAGIYFMLAKNTNNNYTEEKTDAVKIKEEYLVDNENNFAVNLSDTNVYKYISSFDLKALVEKKDGLVFIGDTKNNIVRKNLVVLNDVVSSTSVPQVYYINYNDINSDLKKYLEEKPDTNGIKAGTLIAVESGKILNAYYPNYIEDTKELSENEKEVLFNTYKEIVNKFIEECDENC